MGDKATGELASESKEGREEDEVRDEDEVRADSHKESIILSPRFASFVYPPPLKCALVLATAAAAASVVVQFKCTDLETSVATCLEHKLAVALALLISTV